MFICDIEILAKVKNLVIFNNKFINRNNFLNKMNILRVYFCSVYLPKQRCNKFRIYLEY